MACLGRDVRASGVLWLRIWLPRRALVRGVAFVTPASELAVAVVARVLSRSLVEAILAGVEQGDQPRGVSVCGCPVPRPLLSSLALDAWMQRSYRRSRASVLFF